MVTSALRGIGVELKVVEKAVDLGVDLSADCQGRGLLPMRKARIKAAEAKAARVARLHGLAKRSHLVKVVSFSQATYATEAVVVSSSQAKALRRRLTTMLGYKKGMCSASLISMHKQHNPIAELRWKQVRHWIQLWVDHPELHLQIRKIWRKVKFKMQPLEHTENFNRARGPIGSMIAVLHELGIDPKQPDLWDTGRGRTWAMTNEPIDIDLFRIEFFELVDAAFWEKASRHHLGAGLAGGGNFEAARKLRRRLLENREPMAAGLVESIVTAGMWTNCRCHAAGYDVSPRCVRCGAKDDGEYHRLWNCPKILSAQHRDIASSNYLCRDARATSASDPCPAAVREACFWLRGIIPAAWLSMPGAPRPPPSKSSG